MTALECIQQDHAPRRHEADEARKSLESSMEQIASLRRSIELRAGARPDIASFMTVVSDPSEADEEKAAPSR